MKYFVATIFSRGKRLEISFYAKDIKEAQKHVKLKHSGIIIKVAQKEEPLENQFKKLIASFTKNLKKRKIKPDALIAAIGQLAVMTSAGISIHEALIEVSGSSENKAIKNVFGKLANDINAGHSLSSSMKNFRFELGDLTLAMVQLGEKTGNLDAALYALSGMLEEIRANFVKFKKAMAYPRNIMIAMIIAFTILISYVVPKFKDIFTKLNTELPLPTQILLKLEYIFNNYGLYILASLVLLFIVFRYLISNYKDIKLTWHKILLKIFLINNIIKYSSLSRFTLVFSELVRAGIPITEALDTSASMIENLPLRTKLASIRITVEKGSTLNKGLKETQLFENMIVQMVKAGEDSGMLDAMMQKVAQHYKMKFDAIIEGLSDSIEPIMLIIMASMVILLALGIFLPIWGMSAAIGG